MERSWHATRNFGISRIRRQASRITCCFRLTNVTDVTEQRLAKATRILDFTTFMRLFLDALKKAARNIKGESFALVFPPFVNYPNFNAKSNWMLLHVAYSYLAKKRVRGFHGVMSVQEATLRKIAHLVFVDDAMYTGVQMASQLKTAKEICNEMFNAPSPYSPSHNKPPKWWVVVAAASQQSVQLMWKDVIALDAVCYSLLLHPLSEIDFELAQHLNPTGLTLERYPYIWHHKLPDDISTYSDMYAKMVCWFKNGKRKKTIQPFYRSLFSCASVAKQK